MKRIKERLSLIKSEFTVTAGRIATGDTTVFSRGERMAIVIAGVLFGMLLIALCAPAYAGGDIVDQAKEMANKYYNSLFVIVPVVAALFLLIAVLWAIIVPTTQAARPAIQWGVRIFLGLIVAFCIGGLIKLAKSLTNGQNFTGP